MMPVSTSPMPPLAMPGLPRADPGFAVGRRHHGAGALEHDHRLVASRQLARGGEAVALRSPRCATSSRRAASPGCGVSTACAGSAQRAAASRLSASASSTQGLPAASACGPQRARPRRPVPGPAPARSRWRAPARHRQFALDPMDHEFGPCAHQRGHCAARVATLTRPGAAARSRLAGQARGAGHAVVAARPPARARGRPCARRRARRQRRWRSASSSRRASAGTASNTAAGTSERLEHAFADVVRRGAGPQAALPADEAHRQRRAHAAARRRGRCRHRVPRAGPAPGPAGRSG